MTNVDFIVGKEEIEQLFPDFEVCLSITRIIKGDPFTYDDFTPEQIATLQRPATTEAVRIALIEEVRSTEENKRIVSENIRRASELTRQNSEALRVDNETTRNNNETARQQAEENRTQAEDTRIANEIQRVESENKRMDAEKSRVDATNTWQKATTEAINKCVNVTDNADKKASEAKAQGEYAEAQGNYAKEATTSCSEATTEANKALEACNTATVNAKEATNKCTDKLNELEDITDLVHEAPKDGKQYARQNGIWSEVDDISQLTTKTSFNSVLCNNTLVYTFDGTIKNKTILLKCSGNYAGNTNNSELVYISSNKTGSWRSCSINKVKLYSVLDASDYADFIALCFDDDGNVKAYRNMEFVGEKTKDEISNTSSIRVVLNEYVSFFGVLNMCISAPEIDNVMARFFNNGKSNECEYNTTMLSKNPITDIGRIENARFWVSPKKHTETLNKNCYVRSKVKILNKSSNVLTAEFKTSISDSINYKQTIQPGETINMESWGDYNYGFMFISPYNQTDLVDIDYDIREVMFDCLIDPRFASIDSCNEMISGEKISNARGSFISTEQQYLTNINYRNEYAGQVAYVDGNVYIGTNTIPYTKANWKKITQ